MTNRTRYKSFHTAHALFEGKRPDLKATPLPPAPKCLVLRCLEVWILGCFGLLLAHSWILGGSWNALGKLTKHCGKQGDQLFSATQSSEKLFQCKLGELTKHYGKQGLQQFTPSKNHKNISKASMGHTRNKTGNTQKITIKTKHKKKITLQ